VKENSIRRAVREARAALGTGLKELASRGVPRIIELSGFDYCMIDIIPLMLDQGVMGIQISGVDNAEEARVIVREAKYPPLGSRGMSGMGPHTGYQSYGNRYQTEYAPWGTRTSSSVRRSSRSKD
jgi:2-keto-3-deoxy-L-rhamnonate aldolase RhmA